MTDICPALALPEACVHLWLFSLDPDAQAVAAISAALADEERQRAARFRSEDDRRRYSVARGALRWLIARYVNGDAASVRLDYGPHGKPLLARGSTSIGLEFNLSHSGELALAAFCVSTSVGVDIEHARRAIDPEALIARFGSPGEHAMLMALAPPERKRRFLELWTCKEAWLKATGEGIAAGLEKVEIDVSTGAPRLAGESATARESSLLLLEPAEGVVAAVALRDCVFAMGEATKPDTVPVAPGLKGERRMVALVPRGALRTSPL